jgi:hypothetical protein
MMEMDTYTYVVTTHMEFFQGERSPSFIDLGNCTGIFTAALRKCQVMELE